MDKGIREYEKDLAEVFGKPVATVAGFVTAEFGDDTLVFQITRILFQDGTSISVEGEHDMPYIASDEETQKLFEPHWDRGE